ncbi:MAG: nif-specific transcriptional activator NifA [Deltaproteobacteria bacterium]|nr:MAG: nif-specific transcriptional activator NifA [Deltaproteobacteria bacterium]
MNKRLSGFEAITALYKVSQAVTSSLDQKEALRATLRALAEGLGIERGMLVLADPSTQEATIEVAHNMSEDEIRRGRYRTGEGVVGRVLETGEPMIVPNVGKEPLFLNRTRSRGDLRKSQISFICVPVNLEGETVGALSVDLPFEEEIALDEDERLLAVVAGYVAQAVRIHRMVESEKAVLADENLHLRRALEGEYRIKNFIGASTPMKEVFEQIMLVAKSRATVLLTGESGTGKELAAKGIHYNSARSKAPFIGFSCASLPESILENELFGHERGAFTGATALKKGRFELAHGGTLFLDEVGEIPPNIQVKLLRVIQEREFERLGGKEPIKVDVRIIAATNRNLSEEVAKGRFREDLFYRLNVVPIKLPPLRERKEDIPLLSYHFLKKFCEENSRKVEGFTHEAMARLVEYDWPGNVRELENMVERMVVLSRGSQLTEVDLPGEILANLNPQAASGEGLDAMIKGLASYLFSNPPERGVYHDIVDRVEDMLIDEALAKTGNVRLAAARILGINRNTLYAKLAKRDK